jgi:hypothetical protein
LQTPIGQSVLERQPTHVSELGSHFGVAPEQNASLVHATHEPCFIPLVAHAGPPGLPVQSESVAHGWHVCVDVWQTGVIPAQFAFVSQATQLPEGKSHTLPIAVHCVVLVEEHWPQAPAFWVPVGWQAGVGAMQFASLVQVWQTLFLQTGLVPPQSDALRHCTHVFVARSQRGSGTAQFVSEVQSTHVPRLGLPDRVSHTGKPVPVQSAFVWHARHVCVVMSQTGFAIGQS